MSKVDLFGVPALDYYFYMGELVEEEGKLWFRTGGSDDYWFEISDDLHLTLDPTVYMAKVATNEFGEPTGPVVAVERSTKTDAEIWAEWNARFPKEP